MFYKNTEFFEYPRCIQMAPAASRGGAIMDRNRECDPGICDHCLYIGDGDFICDLHGMGPEETVFVLEDWMRTEHYLQCERGSERG